jgi:hypothetical protein
MSQKKAKQRRREAQGPYFCPRCRNPFDMQFIDATEATRAMSPKQPFPVIHQCDCGCWSFRESGRMREVTPAERLRIEIELPNMVKQAEKLLRERPDYDVIVLGPDGSTQPAER